MTGIEGEWVLVEVPLADSRFWFVSALFAEQDGRLVIAELRVFPGEDLTITEFPEAEGIEAAEWEEPEIGEWSGKRAAIAKMPSGGITARMLKETIKFGDLASELQATLGDVLRATPELRRVGSVKFIEEAAKRPGRTRGDMYYARIALRYVKKLERASPSPLVDLAADLGLEYERARDSIHEARVRGLLTPGHRGKAGGQLTQKTIALLRGQRKR